MTESIREKTHSFLEINSYSISQGLINFNVGAFGAYVFFFYETEIQMNVILLGILFVTYSIWDAINEPLLGNITDKPFKFTKKWGRRLPWVITGVFPWAILYIFIFTPPDVNPSSMGIIIFIYILVILSAFDGFYTLWSVNSEALFPFKFRDMNERRKVSGTKGFWGVIGLVLGLVVPPLIVEYGHLETYIMQAIILALITIICGFLMLPGHREDKIMIQDYLDSTPKKTGFTFFKDFYRAIKKKNFMLWGFLHFMYTLLTGLLIVSLNYFIRYDLKGEAEDLILGMSGYLIVSIFSIPLWIKVANKINNNKLMVSLGAFSMAIATGLLFFATSIITLLILGCLVGLTGAIFFVMQDTINGDVLDEMAILDGERLEATYLGIKFFIGRLANVVQFLVLVIVHLLTNFMPEVEDQALPALIGIRLHLSVIPAIALLIGTLVFYKWYDITPQKSEEIRNKIKEIGF